MIRLIAAIFLYFCALPIFAWNATGHVIIAQIAYENLPPRKQIEIEKLAEKIFYQLPFSEQQKLNHIYPHTSIFAKTAFLPDEWKAKTLSALFTQFNAVLPADLKTFAEKDTTNWHFILLPWSQGQTLYSLHSADPINIVWALNTLEKDFKNASNPNTRALLLVFIAHLAGDIHQPLHVMTNTSQNSKGDKGGNEFCLRHSFLGNCKENLHAYWDSAGEYLHRPYLTNKITQQLQKQYPLQLFSSDNMEFLPQAWALESYQKAGIVYQVHKNQNPRFQEKQLTQAVSKKQLALAGYRLAGILSHFI